MFKDLFDKTKYEHKLLYIEQLIEELDELYSDISYAKNNNWTEIDFLELNSKISIREKTIELLLK